MKKIISKMENKINNFINNRSKSKIHIQDLYMNNITNNN